MRVFLRLLPLFAFLTVSACSDSPTDPEPPAGGGGGSGAGEVATFTVDASADWSFIRFEDGEATAATVADPAAEGDWDVGFFATSVMLNGGAAGPGGLVGHCLCANAGLDDDAVTTLTAESALADFAAVQAAQVPADGEAWTSDVLAPAIDGWYAYDAQTHTVSAAPDAVWKVRTADGAAYAKLHVIALDGATQENAGTITIEYAYQPAAGAPFEAAQVVDVDVSAGPVHFDLDTGATVGSLDAADLSFEGYAIRVNGGVSGAGQAGASPATESFADIVDAGDLTASHYRGDAFGGVFAAHPWYRYDVQGNHQIWPTYDVYLVKRGDAVYKLQLVGYYGPTGDPRQITFRYERLS